MSGNEGSGMARIRLPGLSELPAQARESDEGLPAGAYVREIAYLVSMWPPGHDSDDASSWDIRVEWRGSDRWAVLHSRHCLGTDGEWDWETIPSERTDEWIAAHRFTLEAALHLAREAAPKVVVSGMTPAQAQAWEAARKSEPGGSR